MKSLIIFCAIFAVVFANWSTPTKEQFKQHRDDCLKEGNVPEETANKIRKEQYPNDRDTYCYIRCVGSKSGIWNDRKGYDIDRSLQVFEANGYEVTRENLERCFAPLPGADTCTWAGVNMRCLRDNKYVTKKASA
ncbi:unnamed protein product [Hermetia illucens]|uniref:Uncharacterized protein n=1 Tax=Hermetia illucens TaxID=343691 RepID=A0A7R8UV79_HERIL|nr:general odorant-binding protein 99a-like [Hermetia illucens]CAD7087223.1 unnamed protein product [Hermetia illucens]